MKTIIKNIPNDILYGISAILFWTFLLYTIRGVPPYFNYLFLFFSSILSIFILTPTLYLTPVYYMFSRFILLFISDRNLLGGTIIELTYVPLDSHQNPFLTHNFSASFILLPLQDHLEYLKESIVHLQMIPLPQILIVVLSALPFIFFKKETKRLIENPRFKTLTFLFFYGALIALPSDYLLMFLILKGITSVYILPITLLLFSITPSLLLLNKFFPHIKDARIIFIPIVSFFFFYLIITGGAILLYPLVLFEGLISIFVMAFPYFEMPLIFSGILAYLYIKKIYNKP